jgi:hypothetical protein
MAYLILKMLGQSSLTMRGNSNFANSSCLKFSTTFL